MVTRSFQGLELGRRGNRVVRLPPEMEFIKSGGGIDALGRGGEHELSDLSGAKTGSEG